jgi:hypothetical protein
LKVSGIGPKDELERFRIPLVTDICPASAPTFKVITKLTSSVAHQRIFSTGRAAADPFLRQWVTEGHGPFRSNSEEVRKEEIDLND